MFSVNFILFFSSLGYLVQQYSLLIFFINFNCISLVVSFHLISFLSFLSFRLFYLVLLPVLDTMLFASDLGWEGGEIAGGVVVDG